MNVTNDELNNFLRTIQPNYTGTLGEIQQIAYEQEVPIVRFETARLITVLLSMHKPKNILEIGTAVAFSASLMSQYLQDGGKITTIDRHDKMINKAKVNIEKMGLQDTITMLEGDAREILPLLKDKKNSYDVIFMDAGKGQYINFLPYCLDMLEIGGILLIDDVLQGGTVYQPVENIDKRQRTIHKRLNLLLEEITHMKGLETSIIPIGDGLALCYKTGEIHWKGINNDEQ